MRREGRQPLFIEDTNYRGERAVREIRPVSDGLLRDPGLPTSKARLTTAAKLRATALRGALNGNAKVAPGAHLASG